MIYLDTHAVVWLFQGLTELLSPAARERLDATEPRVSPAVLMELEYLHEIGRARERGRPVIEYLAARLGLRLCDAPFAQVVTQALDLNWARDPFDRLITAQPMANDSELLTKDQTIRDHYRKAVW